MSQFSIHQDRNYGCRIESGRSYKNMRTLVIQNELIRITILLDKGSDIVELLYKPKDIDFLWRSPRGINYLDSQFGVNLTREEFMDNYQGGWQELFPSASGSSFYEGIHTGYHGEAAYRKWDYKVLKDKPNEIEVLLYVNMKRTPLRLEKKIRLVSNSAILYINEKVINLANRNLYYIWGHHPAFGAPFLSENCILSLPNCTVETQYEPTPNNRFPVKQESFWPHIKDRNGKMVNLENIPSIQSSTTDMLFVKNFKEGWFSITNPKLGVGIGMVWPTEMYPYLWIWGEFGGTQGYPWYGNAYVMAVEPMTSLPGTGKHGLKEAIENGTAEKILAQGEVEKEIKLVIYEHTGKVNKIDLSGKVEFFESR